MMAEALSAPLMRAVAEEAAAPYRPSRDDPRLVGIPPPMIPGNEESRTTVCLMQASRGRGGGGVWWLAGLFVCVC